MVEFTGVNWRDGALQVNDNMFVVHEIFSSDVINVVNAARTSIYVSDLSYYVSGCYDRPIRQVTIYWHTHSEIVYAITGLLYCKKIILECGSSQGDTYKIYPVPKIWLFKNRANPIEFKWKHTVKIATIKNLPPAPGLTLGFLPKNGPPPPHDFFVVKHSDRFLEHLSSVYVAVTEDVALESETELRAIESCRNAARSRPLKLMGGSIVQNFILKQACLYLLGERGTLEDVLGSIRSRDRFKSRKFYLHALLAGNAYALAATLNSIHKYKDKLSVFEDRVHNGDDVVRTTVLNYYNDFVDTNNAAVAHGVRVIELFRRRWNFEDVNAYLKPMIEIDAGATRGDVIKLLVM